MGGGTVRPSGRAALGRTSIPSNTVFPYILVLITACSESRRHTEDRFAPMSRSN